MLAALVSQQIVRLRAAFLLTTLVVVPLVAALGTSPSKWFAAKPSIEKSEDPQVAGQAAAAHALVEPKARPTHSHGHSPKISAAVVGQVGTNGGKAAAEFPPKATADNSVLRRWAQEEAPAQSPRAADPPAPSPHAVAASPPSQFRRVEQQLREWGATYYLLEHWSDQGPLYRFHCRMSIGGLKHYNQHFEAVAEDPVAAMRDVLQQVRAWRASLVDKPTT